MKSCEQTSGMSVLEHGESVNRYFEDLYSHLTLNTDLKYEWRMPDWIYENKDLILDKLMDLETIKEYQIMHDCGKPYCKTIDDNGKVHFPNHSKISEQKYEELFGESQISKLIGMDMDIHLLKNDGVPEFVSRPEAITLLITGLCEIHSNASMFGGIESTSFKIKWKSIDKRGNAIFKIIK
jgi:hypothetical protein